MESPPHHFSATGTVLRVEKQERTRRVKSNALSSSIPRLRVFHLVSHPQIFDEQLEFAPSTQLK